MATQPTQPDVSLFAFAVGLSRENKAGQTIDCFYPTPVRDPTPTLCEAVRDSFEPGVGSCAPERLLSFATRLGDMDPVGLPSGLVSATRAMLEADRPLRIVTLEADTDIKHTAEAYLKLHLLSHRLALPNTLNLKNIFAHLPNVAWTSKGAIDIGELDEALLHGRISGDHLEVTSIDKFPRMTNYVVPNGVRIADASRIRLGAYLGEGTTVMHEGFINFNAAALGPNMVEGRISQGVVLGAHSDLGGGSSTMGTLSGGGEITISIGSNCLIGANAGTGIPLGDRCTIEAGLYITAGTLVTLKDENAKTVKTIKARELAGGSDMLFIRNSQTGQIECRSNRKAIALNEQLHAHN